jgi:hypothetical protein
MLYPCELGMANVSSVRRITVPTTWEPLTLLRVPFRAHEIGDACFTLASLAWLTSPPNACIESFMPSLGEGMGETTCTYDLGCPSGHTKENQKFTLRVSSDSSHGEDVSHAKRARVKHASPMKQEPTEVILQDE